jgi:hypothetical protein
MTQFPPSPTAGGSIRRRRFPEPHSDGAGLEDRTGAAGHHPGAAGEEGGGAGHHGGTPGTGGEVGLHPSKPLPPLLIQTAPALPSLFHSHILSSW